MPNPKIESDAASTKKLLADLDSKVDEAKLVRRIITLRDSLRLIMEMPNQGNRVDFLKNEITELETYLAEIRKG